ncbi:MAG: hypothetical protein U0794_07710 [Isosphaeraceae bacterium]
MMRRLNRALRGPRGLVIIPVIVTLVVITVFCTVLMNQITQQRRLVRDEERRMQAEWLAEAALDRGRVKLDANRAFGGETWAVAPEELGGIGGTVRIIVEAVADQPNRKRVRVEAVYPREGDFRAQTTRSLELDLRPEKPGDHS